VGLIGVAGLDGGRGQVALSLRRVHALDEALEAEDALQRLRAIADRVVEAATQLALAEVHVGRDLLDAGRRVTQQPGRAVNRQVLRPGRYQRARHVHDLAGGDGRIES
jgi:hypothetical protein